MILIIIAQHLSYEIFLFVNIASDIDDILAKVSILRNSRKKKRKEVEKEKTKETTRKY